MKLSRLYTFVKLADLGSFSEVAEELKLTQPAVSIQVKALEEHFSVELVKRKSDGVVLTEEGEQLYQSAKEILRIWENIGPKINQLQDLVKGVLNIGASTIPAEYLLPELIVDFCQTYPMIELKMEVGDSGSVIQNLLKGRYDLGIVGVKPKEDKFMTLKIASDKLVLIVPKDYSIGKRGKVTRQELFRERFIFREEGSGTRKAMKEGLARLELSESDLKMAAQLGSSESIIAAVEAGLGISIVSSLAARRAEKLQRVRVVQVEGFDVQREFFLIYTKEQKEKNLIEKFIEYMQKKI